MSDKSHEAISMDTNNRLATLEKECGETKREVAEMRKLVLDLHRRLLEKSDEGEPPFLDRAYKAIRAFEQTSWIGKTVIWAVLTVGSLAGAGMAVLNFLSKWAAK